MSGKLREKIIFLNGIPIMVYEKNANRQFEIEIWLEPESLLKELNLVKLRECIKETKIPKLDYVV